MSYLQFEDESGYKECKICYEVFEHSKFFTVNTCNDKFCKQCMELFLINCIDNGNVLNIKCPECGKNNLEENEIKSLTTSDYWEKYQKLSKREILMNNPFVRFCPQPDCEGYGLGSMKSKKITCSICSFDYCFLCNQKWHIEKCSKIEEAKFELWVDENHVKFCPRCKRRVEKLGGCSKMKCICTNTWCWSCGKNPNELYHEITCIIGKDVWNVKLTWIIIMIFAPISIFLIPFIIFFIFYDQFPISETWWVRYRKCFYLAAFGLSPLILIGMLLIYPCAFAFSQVKTLRKYTRHIWVVAYLILYIISLILEAFIVIIAFFASFLCILLGIILFFLRIFSEKLGKKDYSEDFYPQSII